MLINQVVKGWRGLAVMVCLAVAAMGAVTVTVKPAPAEALAVSHHLPREGWRVVSAPFFDEAGNDFILAETRDDRLFYTFGGVVDGQPSYASVGWTEVPGGITTPYRPAVLQVTAGGVSTIMIAVATDDGRLMVNHLRKDKTFIGWQELPHEAAGAPFFTGAPAIVTNGTPAKPYTELVVVAPSINWGLHYQRLSTIDEEGWSSGWVRWGNGQMAGGVAAAYFDGKFKVFTSKLVIGEPMRLYHADLIVGSDPVWQEVPGQLGSSDDGLGELVASATMVTDSVLTLAAKGVTPAVGDQVQSINLVKTPTGSTWGPWKGYASAASPRAPLQISVSTSNVGTAHQYVIGRDGSVGVLALVPTSAGTSMVPAEGYLAKYVMVPFSDTTESQGRPDPAGTDWTTTVGADNYLNADPWADPASQGTDGLATTKLGISADNLTVARKLADSRLYVTFGSQPRGYHAFGWAAIPGTLPGGVEAKTAFAPAATTLGNDVYVAMVATDQKMYYQIFNAKTKVWNAEWAQVGPGLFSQGPTLTVWHGALQAFAPGLDQKIYWLQAYHHTNFPLAFNIPLSTGPTALKTNKPVAAVEFNNDLIVVARRSGTGAAGEVDGQLATWTIGSFGNVREWTPVPGGLISPGRPAVATDGPNQSVLHVFARDAQNLIKYQSLMSNLGQVYPGAWRAGWTEVPGNGRTEHAQAVTRNGASISVLVTGAGTVNDVWENTVTTNPTTGLLTGGPWYRVPKSNQRTVPLNSGGEPIPDPDNPGPPPAQPVVNWYVYCLSGPGVQDGYLPALDENQTRALAQATEYAIANYGPASGSWSLVLHPTVTPNGCQEPQNQYKWCAEKYEWPGELFWPTYIITNQAANSGAGLQDAKNQVTAAHGPEYTNGHQSWAVTAYDPDQCI
jgi:hypothetical protein